MYQRCPLCNGTGINSTSLKTNKVEECTVCNGEKIINSETGKPPKKEDTINELKLHEELIVTIINFLPSSLFK